MTSQSIARNRLLTRPDWNPKDDAQIRAEIDEELAFHMDRLAEDLIRKGLMPEAARADAARRFGDINLIRSQCLAIQMEGWFMFQKLHLIGTCFLFLAVVWLGTMVISNHEVSAIESLQRTAASDAVSDADRLAALRSLRAMELPGAVPAELKFRSHDVVEAMILLAQKTSNPAHRADIWRQLDEVTDPALVEPLLDSLANDSSVEVRSEAAETLGPFAADSRVRDALERARDTDRSEDVRLQATISLIHDADETKLQQIATDRSEPELVRLMALFQLRRLDRSAGDPRNHDVITAMIEMANATTSPAVRADIFRQLHEVTDPVLEEPLLKGLKDPSEEVRSEAAETLDHYLSSPSVIQALEEVTRNDTSPEVRAVARASLGKME